MQAAATEDADAARDHAARTRVIIAIDTIMITIVIVIMITT